MRRTAAEIETAYRAERQACMSGKTGQDQATCLKEAAAARQQALSQGLDSGQTRRDLRRNALARCEMQAAAEREDCRRLARGEGQRSGSVAGGGVLMEMTTKKLVPEAAASGAGAETPAAAAASAASAPR